MNRSLQGATLIDFEVPHERLGHNHDSVLRFMERVRQDFCEIVPGLPNGCELDLCAGATAHSQEAHPLLLLWIPPEHLDSTPDVFEMIDQVSKWSRELSDQKLWSIVSETHAPTWEELMQMKVYPQR